MRLSHFIHALIESGRVTVPPDAPWVDDETAAAIQVVDAAVRSECPHAAPELSLPVAIWGATLLYEGCRFLVHRHLEALEIDAAFQTPAPPASSAVRIYSADLLLRYLPSLSALARGASPDDPLNVAIKGVAQAWPLSSVGIPHLESLALDPILADPCLRQMYIDRILEREDTTRLTPEIREAVLAAFGEAIPLPPKLQAALHPVV